MNIFERFTKLQRLFQEIKKDKDNEEFRDPALWVEFVPKELHHHFYWPTESERTEWAERRPYTPIATASPEHQLSVTWNFYRIFEAFEEGEYALKSCEMVAPDSAEFRIETWSYPYGGLGPIIALVEAFEFEVLGVDEYGKYLTKEELLANRKAVGEQNDNVYE